MRIQPGRRPRRRWPLLVLTCLLLLTPAISITIGPAAVAIGDVAGVIASHIPGLDVTITWDRSVDAIVWQTRLPRIVAGGLVGAILGVGGVVLQAIVRNPLAEPYVLGVSAGASTGAAAAMLLLGAATSAAVGLAAFAGAFGATLLLLVIAGGSRSPLQLILAGMAVGFGFHALTNLVVFSSDSPEASRSVMFWMLGSLARVKANDLAMVAVVAVLLVALVSFLGPVLDALASGDRTAQSVGIEPSRARLLLLLPVSAAVAIAVATAGGIGFVGLVIPHLMRSLVGHSHRVLTVASALAAALFLIWADAFARIAFAPAELPIGVITGLIGVPFLIVLIRRRQTTQAQ